MPRPSTIHASPSDHGSLRGGEQRRARAAARSPRTRAPCARRTRRCAGRSRAQEAHQHERHRERAEHERARDSERRGDRVGEDGRQVVRRRPRERLRRAEGDDDASPAHGGDPPEARCARLPPRGRAPVGRPGGRPITVTISAAIARRPSRARMLNVRHAARRRHRLDADARRRAAARAGADAGSAAPARCPRITISGRVREQRGEVGLGERVEAPRRPAEHHGLARQHDVLADLLGADADPAVARLAVTTRWRAAVERDLHWGGGGNRG